MAVRKTSKKPRAVRKIEEADAAVAEVVAPVSQSAPVRFLSWLSEIGDQPQMRLLCKAVIAAGVMSKSERLAKAGTHMLVAHNLATEAKDLIKQNLDRTRPRSRDGGDDHRITPGTDHAKEETSFPSGHSAGAIAVARGFARHYPEYQAPALAAAGAVALAQIPRSAHYPSDVAVGVIIGVAAEIVAAQFDEPAQKLAASTTS